MNIAFVRSMHWRFLTRHTSLGFFPTYVGVRSVAAAFFVSVPFFARVVKIYIDLVERFRGRHVL